MKKRGQSKILSIILIILLVLALIVILWNIIKGLLKTNIEITEIKQALLKKSVEIEDVEGDFNYPRYINITIKAGPEQLILISRTTKTTRINVDIMSVVDLSSSINKNLDELKQANINLVNNVLEYENNKIGLITYSSSAQLSHELSENKDSLVSEINTWDTQGLTCIYNGLELAKQKLENSENEKKYIILMTDGLSQCSYPYEYSSEDEIDLAEEIKEKNILIYTIGFGIGEGASHIQNIAEAGGGEYYDSDIGELKSIYTQISTEVINKYKEEYYDYLRIIFYNETTQYSYKIFNPPLPLETKKYEIPLPTEDELNKHIVNIKRIEVYYVIETKDGEPIIGPLLSSWEAD